MKFLYMKEKSVCIILEPLVSQASSLVYVSFSVGVVPHSTVDRERDDESKKMNSTHARCSAKRRSCQTACILA
jgi:hypothetical protein